MNQLNFHNQLIPLLQKAKDIYLLWYNYYKIIPKEHRYTLGQKVDKFLLEIIEAISIASFLKREEKLPYVRLAIRKTDILKIFLLILWETKSLDNSKYIQISEKLNEIGKMLGGWNGNLSAPKENSSNKSEGEK
ncbi:MAG: four helix bundle protein [bacterium]|nr:four helix bundle protein [bacterium]